MNLRAVVWIFVAAAFSRNPRSLPLAATDRATAIKIR
jgi:hypothetical protein